VRMSPPSPAGASAAEAQRHGPLQQPGRPDKGRRVTDAPTRMFHWLFALSFAGAYLTAESEHWRLLHVTLGYSMAILLGFRLLYGLFGPRQVQLSVLWGKLLSGSRWMRAHWHEPWVMLTETGRAGQNFGMALAIALLLTLTVPLVLSGYGTYNEWGEWLEELHEFFGNAFLLVVLAHLALIVGLSLLRRTNLVRPMWSGTLAGKGPDLVTRPRRWLAVLLLLGVVGFGVAYWQQAAQDAPAASLRASDHGQGDDD